MKLESLRPTFRRAGDWLAFSDVTGTGLTVEDEMTSCFRTLEDLLERTGGVSLLSIAHLTLYLAPAAMALFPRINTAYARFFGAQPPTRACVSVHTASLPDSCRLKLEGYACLAPREERRALHVQSVSYWAPANIGPYSQTITHGGRAFMAGQIPLVPASLSLVSPPSFERDVALSLQHVRRVRTAAAREARWRAMGTCEGVVCWIAEHDDWDARWRKACHGWAASSGLVRLFRSFRVHILLQIFTLSLQSSAPAVFVSAAVLPRQASIEWQATFDTGEGDDDGDDNDSAGEDTEADAARVVSGGLQSGEWQAYESRRGRCGYASCRLGGTLGSVEACRLGEIFSSRVFYRPHVAPSDAFAASREILGGAEGATSTIACERLATRSSADWDVIVVWIGSVR